MKRNARHAYNALKKIGAPVFEFYEGGSPVSSDGGSEFKLSAEENYDDVWADYYGEYAGGGYPYVNEKVEKILEKYKLWYEWDNPGSIAIYDN